MNRRLRRTLLALAVTAFNVGVIVVSGEPMPHASSFAHVDADAVAIPVDAPVVVRADADRDVDASGHAL